MRTFNGLLGIILISALGGSVAYYLPATRAQDLSADQQLLVNIKAHIREELYRLPDYTCLESVARFHNQPARQHSKLEGMDTVRLEVVYSNHREWYGSPGDKNFSADNPFGFIGSGMIGTGAFAMIAHNIFEIAQITYQGREDLSGRSAASTAFICPDLPCRSISRAGAARPAKKASSGRIRNRWMLYAWMRAPQRSRATCL